MCFEVRGVQALPYHDMKLETPLFRVCCLRPGCSLPRPQSCALEHPSHASRVLVPALGKSQEFWKVLRWGPLDWAPLPWHCRCLGLHGSVMGLPVPTGFCSSPGSTQKRPETCPAVTTKTVSRCGHRPPEGQGLHPTPGREPQPRHSSRLLMPRQRLATSRTSSRSGSRPTPAQVLGAQLGAGTAHHHLTVPAQGGGLTSGPASQVSALQSPHAGKGPAFV